MREDEENYRKELEKVERLAYYGIKYGFPAMFYVCIIFAFLLSGKLFLIISFVPIIIVLSIVLYADFKQKSMRYLCWSTYDTMIRMPKALASIIIHGSIIVFGVVIYFILFFSVPLFEIIVTTLTPWMIVATLTFVLLKYQQKIMWKKWGELEAKYFKTPRNDFESDVQTMLSKRKIHYHFSTIHSWNYFKGCEPHKYTLPDYNLDLNIYHYGRKRCFITIGKITDSNRAFAQQLKQIVDESATCREVNR
ncbi:MAG: hypothetical protein KJ655_05820 [Candidatus Thermoplasmatota archaeon]|nr:hypothetical protein [Candidatus Thermoplasmatota archaeon]